MSYKIKLYRLANPAVKQFERCALISHGLGLEAASLQPFVRALEKETNHRICFYTCDLPGHGFNDAKLQVEHRPDTYIAWQPLASSLARCVEELKEREQVQQVDGFVFLCCVSLWENFI